MTPLESWTLLAAVSLYVLAFGSYIAALVWRSRRLNSLAVLLTIGALVSQTVSMILRWIAIGHPPVFGSFENALAGSWFVILLGLIVAIRKEWLSRIGLFTTPMAVAIIAFGLIFDRSKFPLTISERSLWVDLHATFAWLSYGSYTLAFIVAVLILIKLKRSSSRLASSLPTTEIMDDWLFKFIIYGFITQAFTIASGAYYQFIIFGRWWRWDPIESVSLVSWFVYALFIHLKRSFGWQAGRLAWIALTAMIFVITAYWLMGYWPPGSTFHVFDIGTRIHIE